MRSPAVRKAIHARLHPRQGVAPVGPAARPPAAHDTSFSVYLSTGTGVMTAGVTPTATALVIDTTIRSATLPSPTPSPSAKPASAKPSTSDPVTTTILISASTSDVALPTIAVDPAQQVYNGMTLSALHALPPWVMMGAIGGAILLVLITAYCFICRWYYKRLPRSTARWDIDDKAKELVYGDQPRFSSSEKPTSAEDDRRGMAVGDSYFPQGETWRKFEGRTARHPESFIYTDQESEDPDSYSVASSPISGGTPSLPAGLAQPRPRFAHSPRGQIDSVFSTVSFPTTHRADSIRESNFFPDGFEHDGEVWDLASPGFVAEQPRPSMHSTARSVTINRASIFGAASACARGSVVIYDSQPMPTHTSILDDDPVARSGEGNGGAYVYPTGKYSGKKSFDGGKRSMDGHHTRTKSRDVRALGTLVEDMDEGAKMPPLPRRLRLN